MSVRLKQVRKLKNESSGIAQNSNLLNSEKAISIGIQAPEGTKFKISTDGTNYGEEIMVGRTGIFEWSVANTNFYIRGFKFTSAIQQAETYIVDFYIIE